MPDPAIKEATFSLWYPRDHVVGVLETPEAVDAASRSLQDHGLSVHIFPPQELPEKVQRAEGRFGFLKRILAGWDTISTDEAGAMRRFRSAAARGHTTVAVRAPERAQAKAAADVLRAAGGHDIWYYRSWVTEEF